MIFIHSDSKSRIVVLCCKGPLTADKRFEAHWNSWEIFIEIDCKAKVNWKHRSAATEIVFRVNWFVDLVNWTNDEDWEFNSFSNSIRADSFNELFVGWFWVVKDEIEIVERGIPFETAFWFPVESKFVFNWESVLTECWWKIKFS